LLFNQPAIGFVQKLSGIGLFFLQQFGVIGLGLAAIGALNRNLFKPMTRGYLWWVILVYTIFTAIYDTWDYLGYLLPAFMVIAVWIGLGMGTIWNYRPRQLPLGQIMVVLIMIAGLGRAVDQYPSIDPRRDKNAHAYAEHYLMDAPKNAILVTREDGDTFPLWAYHHGLGWREDLAIVVGPLWHFEWYQDNIQITYSDVIFPSSNEELTPDIILAINSDRPVCESWPDSNADYGIYYSCRHP
jgi:hypothetical protein